MAISDNLILFNIRDGDAGTSDQDGEASITSSFYYIARDRQRCYKFYNTSGTFVYTPSIIKLTAYQTIGGRRNPFNGTIMVNYYDTLGTIVKTQSSQIHTLNLDFSSITDNIAYVTIDLMLDSMIVYSEVMDVDYGTSDNMAQFAVNATNITGTINDASVMFSQQGIKITNGDFTILNNDVKILSVDQFNHIMSFKGAIDSQSGTIGGWHINANGIYSDNMQTGLFADDSLIYNTKKIRFWSGRSGNDSGDYAYNFYITNEGQMYAANANIQGTIHALNGDITGKLIVGSDLDGIIISGENNSFIGSSKFASGPNGYGWRLDQDGTANFTNAYVSGTFTSSVFEYNTTSSVGGDLYVSPTFSGRAVYSSLYVPITRDSAEMDETLITVSAQSSTTQFTFSNNLYYVYAKSSSNQYSVPRLYIGSTDNGLNGFIPGQEYRITFQCAVFFTRPSGSAGGEWPGVYLHLLYKTSTATQSQSKTLASPLWKDMATFHKADFNFVVPQDAVNFRLYLSPYPSAPSYFTNSGNALLIKDLSIVATNISRFKFENSYNNILEKNKQVIISGMIETPDKSIKSCSCAGTIRYFGSSYVAISHDTIDGQWVDDVNIIDNSMGLLLTATDNHGPFMDVYNKVNSPMPLVRLGNLEGLTDAQYFDTIGGYGLYASNAFLSGQLMLPNAGITNQQTRKIETSNGSSAIRIWAGRTSESVGIQNANFIVTEDGTMIARQGIFNGKVEAIDSIFSGVIRAAGIVIDDTSTENKEADYDHFFVAYNDNPGDDYNNYILNIGQDGLSIWQGGFRVYSDEATDTIYGYNSSLKNNPIPYIYLVDAVHKVGSNTALDARLVVYKQHFIQVTGSGSSYAANSILIDNGVWFGEVSSIQKMTEAQIQGYNNALAHNNGISYIKDSSNGNYLNIESEQLRLASERNISINNNVNLTGQLNITKGNLDNEIILGNCAIKQHYDSSTSIGFDFIVG